MPSTRRLRLGILVVGALAGGTAVVFAAEARLAAGARTPPRKTMPAALRGERSEPGARTDEAAAALAYDRQRRLPVGERRVPVERYVGALAMMAAMPHYSTRTDRFLPTRGELAAAGQPYAAAAGSLGAWDELGPGNIGGRTRALLVDPTAPATMYAAAVAGGIWKTTNGGTTWTPLADLLPNIAFTSLAFDPSTSRTLYAGTGEGFFNGDAVQGLGIYKSTDAGVTWTRLAATANANFNFVNDLAVSKVNPSRVYAATEVGVLRSLDGGATWTRVLNPQVDAGCLDLAIRTDTATGDTVFAACGNFQQATVWRNKAAETATAWSPVLTEAQMGRTSLALAPSNQNVVYALASSLAPGDFQYGLRAVFRSANGGDSWTAQVRNTSTDHLSTLLLSNTVFGSLVECDFDSSNAFFNQGWYDNVIAVDPKDPNKVWAGGVDLFRSDDAGKTWGVASYWWTAGEPSFAHADQHAIVFHPNYNGTSNKTLWVGNDGGLWKTANARAAVAKGDLAPCDPTRTPFVWTNLNHGYAVTQFYHGLPYPDGATYFGGTQDNGTNRGNDADGADAWESILGGDGGYVAISPADTDVLYAENTGLSLAKSINGGRDFARAVNGISASESFLFIAPFTMDSANASRLWIGGNSLWRTKNAAGSWQKASRPVSGGGSVSAIAVAPSDANRVLAGTSLGHIHRTTAGLTSTGSTAWPVVRPRQGFVSWVAFDPHNANVAYATYSNFGGVHVWKSTNGGAAWTALDGSGAGKLPDVPAHTIVVDPANASRLYLGTDLGVFASTDGGANWAVENTGFANVITESLAIQTSGAARTLFAFTHGRGVWRVALP